MHTLRLTSHHVYATVLNTLQDFWIQEFIMPPLPIIDLEMQSRKHTSFEDNTIYHHSITRAAILSCIASACRGNGIFASNMIMKFWESPASLFEEKFNRSHKFRPAVITNRDRILVPLFQAVENCILEDPGLIEKASLLGNLVHRKMVKLHVGGPIDIDHDLDDSPQIPAVTVPSLPKSFKKKTLPKSIPARNSHILPELEGNLLDFFLTTGLESPCMVTPGVLVSSCEKLSITERGYLLWILFLKTFYLESTLHITRHPFIIQTRQIQHKNSHLVSNFYKNTSLALSWLVEKASQISCLGWERGRVFERKIFWNPSHGLLASLPLLLMRWRKHSKL